MADKRLTIAKLMRSEPASHEDTQDLLYAMCEMPGFITGYIRPDGELFRATMIWNTYKGNGGDPEVPGVETIEYATGRFPKGDEKYMQLWTCQMSKWRLADAKKLKFLDTTVKSGVPFLAPNWQIVLDVKSGKITPEEYTKVYEQMMDQSQINHPELWDELVTTNRKLVISCYCPAGKFCHRHLLVPRIERWAKSKDVVFEYMGELTE